MKRTFLDRLIGYFSPNAGIKRDRARMISEAIRGYDAASLFNTSDWSTVARTSANAETRVALSTVRDRSRDLVRNNAYAAKAVNVIVSNTVGAGIAAKISGRTDLQTKRINALWKEWAETTNCDKDSKLNFASMQAVALRSIVESGEVIARKVTEGGYRKLQLLEPDYINQQYSNNIDNVQGIWIDPTTTKILAYELYNTHPGDFRAYNLQSFKVPASDIIHAYRIDRIGQLRGMPWAASVVNALKDFSDFQNATLIRQKIAACYAMFITEKETDGTVSPSVLKERRQLDGLVEPGSAYYLAPGQSVTLANPPGVDQYDPFARQTLREAASGLGISYESISGDYSQVNFSSGRMGHLEMQRNIDSWRWQMLIPMFCQPAFEVFLQWCQIKGVDVNGVTCEWTPPAREMIDPTKEIEALKNEVRSGFKSLPEAIRERGLNPELVIEESSEFNTKVDELGLIFDSDPRRTAISGMLQSVGSSASGNGDSSGQDQEDAPPKSDQSGANDGQ